MTYKKRKLIFIALTVLFFLSIPIIILFTEGYRFDFENKKLVQTGGLDLAIQNTNSMVFLNGELERETSFIFRSAIFRNILPGEYDILVAKEDYKNWQKSVEIIKGHVKQFPSVRLFPETLEKEVYTRDTRQIFISPQKDHAIILGLTPEDEEVEEDSRANVSFLDLSENEAVTITSQPAETRLEEVKWTENGRVFYLKLVNPQETQIVTGNINNPSQLINWTEFVVNNYPATLAETTQVNPTISRNRLLVFTEEENNTLSLNELNLENRTIRPRIAQDIITYKTMNEELYYVDTGGSIQMTNIEEGEVEELSTTAILEPSLEDSQLDVREDGNAISVINNGALFIWQRERPLTQVDEDVDNMSFPVSSNNLVYWNSDKITIYWLEDVFGPPRREIGNKEEIHRFNDIQNVQWINQRASHLAVQTPSAIYITELDSRGGRNIAEYEIESDNAIFKINHGMNSIFALKNDNEFVSLNFE